MAQKKKNRTGKKMYCGLCAKPITDKFDIVNVDGRPMPVHKHH